ncbi:hypothetical protein Taro_022851 [Colocasia esculenta]|uniref:Uncharacterized protein n=1 Tax=Colocasia esculenta TaxID=4460 RepID=A0A843UVL7_COLES|nr:hypothetical protein [Colocasia esculenta]
MPKILRGGEENSKLEFRTYWGPLGAVGGSDRPGSARSAADRSGLGEPAEPSRARTIRAQGTGQVTPARIGGAKTEPTRAIRSRVGRVLIPCLQLLRIGKWRNPNVTWVERPQTVELTT